MSVEGCRWYTVIMLTCTMDVTPTQGIVGCLGSTLRKEGLRALYRGLSASLTGIVPYAGTELTIITLLNNLWEATYPESTPGPALHLATGNWGMVLYFSLTYVPGYSHWWW